MKIGVRPDRTGQIHRESCPSVAASKIAAVSAPKFACFWKTQAGTIIGHGLFDAGSDPTRLKIRYDILSNSHLVPCKAEITVTRVETATGIGGHRHCFKCPRCGYSKGSLYYLAKRWACGDCLGLVYMTQRMDGGARKARKLEQLREQLRHGRPKGMHNKTYRRLCDERNKLTREMKERNRPVPNSELLSTQIHTHWIIPEQEDSAWKEL